MSLREAHSIAMRRKSQSCGLVNTFFIFFQVLLLLVFLHFAARNYGSRQVNTYPAFAEAREHFINTMGYFTVLREADPQVSERTYLKSQRLSSLERDSLRYFIEDYIEFHKLNREKGPRYLIFKPRGTGIGDRMGCLMFAYWASVVSRRVFLVDWQDPFPLKDFLTEASGLAILLEPKQETVIQKKGSMAFLNSTKASLMTYESVLASNVNIILMETNKVPGHLSVEFLSSHLPKNIKASQARGMRSNYNFHRAFLHHVLKLSDKMRRDQQAFFKKHSLTGSKSSRTENQLRGPASYLNGFVNKGKPYIAVHARLGKGVGEYPTNRFKGIAENVKVAAMCLASRAVRLAYLAGNPALPLYLATDTPEFRDLFRSVVASMSHRRVEVFTGDWNVIHSTRLRRRAPNGTEIQVDKGWEAMRGSYMDLMILGHGEHMLALYSSFPRLAFALGNAETLIELRNEICLSEERWR